MCLFGTVRISSRLHSVFLHCSWWIYEVSAINMFAGWSAFGCKFWKTVEIFPPNFQMNLNENSAFRFYFQYIPLLSQLLSKNRRKLHHFLEFSGQYIYRNDHRNTAYNRICSEQMDVSIKKCILKAILMTFGASGSAFSSCYSSFALGVKTTTVEFKFPFVAEKSATEFYINLVMQTIILFHGAFIYVGIEIGMEIFENFTAVSTKLIQNELIQIDDKNERRELSETQLRFLFRNILLQSSDCDRCVCAMLCVV